VRFLHELDRRDLDHAPHEDHRGEHHPDADRDHHVEHDRQREAGEQHQTVAARRRAQREHDVPRSLMFQATSSSSAASDAIGR
jgi:hypothetical protein